MKVSVLDINGNDTGRTVELPKEIFGVEPNDHAIYLDVKQYMANRRQGTHKTKDKSEVRASTRKIYRQKGTGNARHGSLKANIFVGGGRAHGPRPRDYSFKLNKKLKRVARLSALAYKATGNNICVIEDFNFETPRTKEFVNILSNLKVNTGRTLVVVPEANRNVLLSGRNIKGNNVMRVSDINTYEIMLAGNLVFTENAIKNIA
jgi:large subunit ribosomal protein L4